MKKLLITYTLLLTACTSFSQKQPDVGDKAPLFSLPNQDGKIFNLKDSLNKNFIVIFFYPKDESPVCTKEACTFRDSASLFMQLGATVVGINQGSIASHKKFQQDDKLPYQLLSDTTETVIKTYGVKGTLLTDRETFIVDKTGQVVFKYHSLTNGVRHAEEVLKYLREANKQ